MNLKAIKKAEKKKNTEGLIEALDDLDLEVRRQAAEALDRLGWKPSNVRENVDYLTAKREFKKCSELGEPALEPLIGKLNKDRFLASGFELALILVRSGDGRAVDALEKYAATPGSVKNELIGFLLQLRQKSSEYADLAAKQVRLNELYDELNRTPFEPSAWGLTGNPGNTRIYEIGDELANKVEWVNECAYQLIIYLCSYAYDFKKYWRNDIYRTLYACNGYLSEFGDTAFIQPLIALMLASYLEGDLEIASRCGVLLGQAGRSQTASKYVKWAKDNGLIRTPQVLTELFGIK